MNSSTGRFRNHRFPFTIDSTNEFINSYEEFIRSNYWKNKNKQYIDSQLNKICFKCKRVDHFTLIPRTMSKLGKEQLTDLLPVCFDCWKLFGLNKLKNRSKKKSERFVLQKYAFRPNDLTQGQIHFFLNIKPRERGKVLCKYFLKKTAPHKPSQQWLNCQVQKSCKWIRKKEEQFDGIQLDDV